MNRQTLKKQLWILILILISNISFGQSFEGWINYKKESLNPNPAMIPDSIWQQVKKNSSGERGYDTHKYYYKNEKYMSEVETSKAKYIQAYNDNNKFLYLWQPNTDTVITFDSKRYMDEFVEIIDSKITDTILGIPCKSIILKSLMGEITLWYNEEYLKMDANLYSGHKFMHLDQILKKIGCLPLKMEQTGFMIHIVQTAIEFKEESISDSQFDIPTFKTILMSPIN